MSLLDFMEMNVLECITECFLSFILCISFCGIGHFFVKGNCIAFKSVIGMSFVSVLELLCMSYCAVLAKYVIYFSIAVSFFLAVIIFAKNNKLRKEVLKSFLPVFLIFLYFIIRLFILIVPKTGFVDFNCHETYFAAPSLEIFKADYFSRLRLIDVYPYEWSKYHFFNGAFTAIPLSVFIKKNYVSFLFAKFLTIALYLGALFDCIRNKYGFKKASMYFIIGCLICFVVAYNSVTWSSFTNSYSMLILTGIVWILLVQEDWGKACMVSLILAISTSRSTLTGGLFFLFSLGMMFNKEKKSVALFISENIRCALFCMLVGGGVLIMIGSGLTPSNQVTFNTDFMGNMFNYAWLTLIPMGVLFEHRSIFKLAGAAYQIHLEFFILPVYIFILVKNIKRIEYFILINWKKLGVAGIFILEICFVYIYKKYGFNSKKYIFIMTSFVILYLLPILTVRVVSDDRMNVPLGLFIISSLMQYMVFAASTSGCNYQLIVAPLLICISKQVTDVIIECSVKNSIVKKLCLIFVASCGLYFVHYDFRFSFFGSPNDFYHTKLKLQNISYIQEPFVYESDGDADFAKLNALKGNRVHYLMTPNYSDSMMNKNSMTMRFIPED